jgi:hypothetical protein
MHLLRRIFEGPRRQPGWWKHCLLPVGCTVFCLLYLAFPARPVEPSPIPHDKEAPSEYELKAIYLYNFLQFVQWPEECHFPGGHAQEIAVVGGTSLQPVLLSLQAKLREKNKDLTLVFYDSYQEGMNLSNCCLLFIASSEMKKIPEILKSLDGKQVLTVTDAGEEVDSGVMITLLSRQNKIRWAVNRKPVTEAGLKMSAKLLEIAERVIE